MVEGGADQVDQSHGAETDGEGQHLDSDDAEREVDAQDGSKCRARGDPENIGRHEGIAEQPLISSAGCGQRRAHRHGGENPGATHFEDHRLDCFRQAARRTRDLRPQQPQQIAEADRKPTAGERD